MHVQNVATNEVRRNCVAEVQKELWNARRLD